MNSELAQRSEAWIAARVGKVTASRVYDICARTKAGKTSSSRSDYMLELLCERLSGKPSPRFASKEMQWGIDNEAEARTEYTRRTGLKVIEVGFVDHPQIPMCGASPDGLVLDGLLEIKCPKTSTHIELLTSSSIPPWYEHQMAWQLNCTGRKWCDFVSFDPRLPPNLSFFLKRYTPTARFISEVESEVESFQAELDRSIVDLNERFPW